MRSAPDGMKTTRRVNGRLFVILVAGMLLLNLWILATAIPETSTIDGGCCVPNVRLAKDFSAYYTAAWRLFNDPSQIYFHGQVSDGETAIVPQPQEFKYLPSFLLLVCPFLALPYGEALFAFDVLQFLLLPIIAALVYVLVKDRGLAVVSVVAAAVLVLPFPLPTPHWSVSASYYWQWAEGQSKVLETFLLLSSMALARKGRPRAAGVVFGLAAFDPRFALLGLPLLAAYSDDLKRSFGFAALTLVVTNVALFYPPTLNGFVTMVFTSGFSTPPYYYAFIPMAALLSLWILDHGEVFLMVRKRVGFAF